MDVAITEIKRCHLDVLHEWERDEKLQVQTGVDVPRTYEQFLHAYKAYLNGEKPNLYLRAVLLDGQLIGKVELFRTTEKDFIGMVIAEKRNSGVGTRALFLFLDEIYERFGIKHVFAEVYEDNTRSLHFFKKNGFQTTREKKREWFRGKPRELITMKKDLQ